DVPARGGGVIDVIGRHRDTVDIALELGWQFNDHLKPFVRYRWNDHGYDQAPPRVLVDRDGDGRAIVGGVEIVFERQLRARLYGGHMMQDFDDDDPNLEQADGIGYGAEVDWQVAPETQLRFDALREIEEASEGFESGRFASTVRLRASHRLSDRLSLAAALGYVRRNYVGTTREADTWSGRIGATWQLPLNLYTTLGWRYSERDSTVSGRSYARHVALLEFGWRP
ncbi:MAG: outer membrane beta-barrel protein, partial [Gammaproteobacteria bacterium]